MKTIILAGGGHSHLSILKKIAFNTIPDTKWILISSNKYQYYSGMFSGYIEGLYSIDDMRIDLAQLAKQANCLFYDASISKIDATAKQVVTDDGQLFSYDYLSLDIGSHTNNPSINGLTQFQSSLKPSHHFPTHAKKLRDAANVVIIGSGAAACEMALSLQAWKDRQNKKNELISLIHSNDLLGKNGKRASQLATTIIDKNKIQHYEYERAEEVTEHHVLTDKGKRIPYDEVVFLGGGSAPDMLKHSGLAVNKDGFLLVNSSLQSIDNPFVFGAGDCVSLVTHPHLEKSGVHAVRQGPFLWNNLRAALKKTPFVYYSPQKKSMAILSTGNKEALLLYGKIALHGKWAWRLKDRIDRKFVHKYK